MDTRLSGDLPGWTEAQIADFAARAGLTHVTEEVIARLKMNADKVSAVGLATPRMAREDQEPALRMVWPVPGDMPEESK